MTFLSISLELVNVSVETCNTEIVSSLLISAGWGLFLAHPLQGQTSPLLRHRLPQKEGIASTQTPLYLKCFMVTYHCPVALASDPKLHLLKNLAHSFVYLDPASDSVKLYPSLTCMS